MDTVESHRRAVRDAVLDATAGLVAEHGVAGVSMSGVAEAAGVGRATLYRYFPDLSAVLDAWHERQVTKHLHELRQVAVQTIDRGNSTDGAPTAALDARLRAVLTAYAFASAHGAGADVAAALHHGERMDTARAELVGFIRDLLIECAEAGVVRTDVPSGELTSFVLHSLGAAGEIFRVSGHGRAGHLGHAGEAAHDGTTRVGRRRRGGRAPVDRLVGLVLSGLRPL